MTQLVGSNNITSPTGRQLGVNNRTLYQSFVASASGTATSILIYMQGGDAAGTFKLGLWSSSGTLITSSAGATMPASDGWVSASITASITSGVTYLLGIMANGSAGAGYPTSPYYYTVGSGSTPLYNDGGTYPTVPNVVPGSDNNLGAGNLPIYIDGTAGGGSPTITDVDTDESITAAQTNVVFTVTNAGATQSTSTLSLIQGAVSKACSIDSWSATSIQADTPFDFTAPTTSLKYGAATARLTVSAVNGDLAITIAAPSGKAYVDLVSINTTSGYRFSATADIAIGDQIEISNIQGGTTADIVLNNDGTYDSATAVWRFQFRVWSTADQTWGALAYEYPGDPNPTAFSFTDVTGATLSTQYTSNTITLAGMDSTSPITVTGGTYSINGGAYTSADGTVVNGDQITVRVTSSGSFSTAVNVVLSIGSTPVTDTYTVTTAALDTTPNAFSFVDQSNVALSTVITSAAVTIGGINSPAAVTVTGGTADINGSGTFSASPGNVSSGDTVRARHTSSASNSTAVNTVVTVGGVSDTFTSTTVGVAGASRPLVRTLARLLVRPILRLK